jgi:hypothetical protein
VTGNGHTLEAIPIDRLKEIFTTTPRAPVRLEAAVVMPVAGAVLRPYCFAT